ncbi:hypothetical protein [Humibacillus xanthopallidus]|uniref:hypothetical protein n=1 Tax=Humibacillus xanthopallidus TaxID=412689 RepID=UPI00384B93F8
MATLPSSSASSVVSEGVPLTDNGQEADSFRRLVCVEKDETEVRSAHSTLSVEWALSTRVGARVSR